MRALVKLMTGSVRGRLKEINVLKQETNSWHSLQSEKRNSIREVHELTTQDQQASKSNGPANTTARFSPQGKVQLV